MKNDIKDLSGCKKELEVEIPAEEVSEEFEKTLKKYAQKAKIKGFRPGKAPPNLVKRMFYSEIKSSVLESMVPKALNQELKSHELNPLNSPVIKDLQFKEKQPLKFKAQVEVWPDFELPQYKGIKVKKKDSAVSEEEIENSLKNLQLRSAQYVPVENRGVKNGDYVFVELKGKDKKTNKFLPTEKTNILVGHQNNPPQLNENIVGLKPQQQRNFEISFPEDYPNQRVAGKDIQYNLKVFSIKEQKLPEINDDFAKDLGEYKNLDQLKQKIKKELKSSKENNNKREMAEEIIQKISGMFNLDLPESVVENEQQAMLKKMLSSAGESNIPEDKLATLKSQAKKKAKQNIKKHLILNKIAKKENIEVTEEEITEELKTIAQANNLSLAKVRETINKEGKKEQVRENIRLRKTVDFLVRNAIIE